MPQNTSPANSSVRNEEADEEHRRGCFCHGPRCIPATTLFLSTRNRGPASGQLQDATLDKEWDEIARRTDELIANARESKGVVAVSQEGTAASSLRSFFQPPADMLARENPAVRNYRLNFCQYATVGQHRSIDALYKNGTKNIARPISGPSPNNLHPNLHCATRTQLIRTS